MEHSWRRAMRGKTIVLECENDDCEMVWWPDRMKPKKPCPVLSQEKP